MSEPKRCPTCRSDDPKVREMIFQDQSGEGPLCDDDAFHDAPEAMSDKWEKERLERKADFDRRRSECGCGVNQYCDTCLPPMTQREILESRLSTAKRNLAADANPDSVEVQTVAEAVRDFPLLGAVL